MYLLKPQIGLFVGNDLSSSILLKHLLPDIQRLGWRAKVYLPQNKPIAPTADYRLREFYLYERVLLSEAQHILDLYPTMHTANCYSYKTLTKIFDVPIEPVRDVNAELFLDEIAKDLDAALSVRCLQIFGLPFINIFQNKGGLIWNLHSGALPECRGAMPIFWTMMNNKPKVTLSLHKITAGIDQGDVLAERQFDYSPAKSLLEVSCDSIEHVAPLLKESLDSIGRNNLASIQRRSEQANYYSYPKSDHLELFFRSGKKMLPQVPIDYVVSQLSGSEPILEAALQEHLSNVYTQSLSKCYL